MNYSDYLDEFCEKYGDPKHILYAGYPDELEEYVNRYSDSDKFFALPWYSYSEVEIGREGPFNIKLHESNGTTIFPPKEFIIDLAHKNNLKVYGYENPAKRMAVFMNRRNIWEMFLTEVLRCVCFAASGMYVRAMHKYFWDSVIRTMGGFEKTKDILIERRNMFGGGLSGNFVHSVIEEMEKCRECGSSDMKDLTGITVGSPFGELRHYILKKCARCGSLRNVVHTEKR